MRVVGNKRPKEMGTLRPPSAEERAWIRSFAKTRTAVPKGIYRYRSHQEANADWDRWNAELVAKTAGKRQK